MNSVDISILIVNWNARELLYRCLVSLHDTVGVRTEVIVVDNASADDSVSMIRADFPGVRLIVGNENRGFAAANNLAASLATGRYLLLLNPDTEVPPYTLAKLIAYADEHVDVGIIGPRLINTDGTLQRSCWRNYPGIAVAFVDAFYLWKLPWLPLVRRSEYSSEELNAIRDVDHLLGACILIRRAAWETVGFLDERYFLFLEETDWCRRAKKKGLPIIYYPFVTVTHHGQHSMHQQASHSSRHFYRSYCQFYRGSPRSTRAGLFVLRLIIAIAILIRITIWFLRSVLSNDLPQKKQAHGMMADYLLALREVGSL